jgi:hypothetical protein
MIDPKDFFDLPFEEMSLAQSANAGPATLALMFVFAWRAPH